MGAVYVARAVEYVDGVPPTCAIKVLPPAFARSKNASTRFLRESRIALGLPPHPSLVRAYDAGAAADDGVLWIAMELIDGVTVRQRLASKGPMRVDESVALIRQLLEALAVLHSAGLVHRDIKPENLMLMAGWRMKLIDLGLARDLESDSSPATESGVVPGTVGYVAPEALLGGGELDAR